MMVFDWMVRRSTFLLLCLGFFLLSTTTGEPSYKLGRHLLTVTVDTSTVPISTTGATSNNGGTGIVGTSSQGTVGISSQQNEGTTASTTRGASSVSDGTMTMMVNSVKNTSPMTTMKATEKSSVMTAPTQTMSTVTTAGATRENTSQKLSTFSPSTVDTTEEKRSTTVPKTTAEMSGTIPPTMSPSQTDPIADTTTDITIIKASQSTACETCNQTISTYPDENATNLRNWTAQVNQTSSTTDTTYSMLNSITTTPVNVTGQGSSSVLNPEQVKGLIMICTTIGVLTILSIVSYSLKVCWWDKRPPKVDKGRKVYEVPPTAPRKVPKRKKSLPRDPRRGDRRRDDLESAEPYQSFDYDKYDHAYIQPVDHHPSGRYVYAYGGSSKSSLGSMPEEPEDVYLEMHQ